MDKFIKHINKKINNMDKDFIPNKNNWNAGYSKGYYDALVYCLNYLKIENVEKNNLDLEKA